MVKRNCVYKLEKALWYDGRVEHASGTGDTASCQSIIDGAKGWEEMTTQERGLALERRKGKLPADPEGMK